MFSPELPNKSPSKVLPVFGPPRVEPLGVCMAKVLSCNAGEGAQKVGTILPLPYQALCPRSLPVIQIASQQDYIKKC